MSARFTCALAVFVGCLTVTGCGQSRHPDTIHAYVGIDTSGSDRNVLGPYAANASRLAGTLQPAGDRLTMFRLDDRCLETYDGLVPESREVVEDRLIEQMKQIREAPPRKGTYPARFWAEVARRSANEKRAVVIVLFTDGENSDPSAASRRTIASAARSLARNKYVRAVIVCGVRDENRARLRQELGSLGKRLELQTLGELDPESALYGS